MVTTWQIGNFCKIKSLDQYLSKIGHILDHKTDLNKCKSIQVVQIMFSYPNKIKLELMNRNISGNFPNI